VINHLWQSTVFAILAAILTLAVRRNRAQVRYWLWFSASLKFLFPFSLLMSLGSHVEWAPSAQAAIPVASSTLVQFTQPFPENVSFVPSTADASDWIPMTILAVWACGFAAVALMRLRGWLRVRAAVHASAPLEIPVPVDVRSSPGLLEPGVVGFLRPILLLPEGIAEYLTPRQLEAVLAHELCHVRRRDNLTSAIHMIVEAVFWFHPLVWWIGARLVEERERSCDEAVLSLGSEPQVYAEAILNVCKSYLESPLRCVSGVTGSDLKKRIQTILTGRVAGELNFAKRVALAVAGIAAITLPVIVGILNAPAIRAQSPANTPQFEVASIKLYKDEIGSVRNSVFYGPQGINFGGVTLAFIIGEAYNFPVGRIQGPESLTKESLWGPLRQGYDIAAKAEHAVPKEQLRLMLQSLLAGRFKLTLHWEAKEGPVYKLVVAKGGPKLEESDATAGFSFSGAPDGFVFRNAGMVTLSGFLSGRLDRAVVDQTGLKGLYNFVLKRPEDARQEPPTVKSDGLSTDSPSAAAFADALKELGLRLVADRAPVDYLVIDHIERPTEN